MRDKLGAMLKAGDTVRLSQGGLGTVIGESGGFAVVEQAGWTGSSRWNPSALVRTAGFMPEASDTPEWFNEGEFWKSQFEAANRDARHYLQELGEKTRLLSDAMGLLSTAAPFMASALKPSTDTRLEWAENLETLHDELESPE